MEELIKCPLSDDHITESTCHLMREVFEETRSICELADDFDFTDENQQKCLQCERHCK